MTDAPPSIAGADWLRAQATQAVFSALSRRGHISRAVGGCVRNSLFAHLENTALDKNTLAITDIDIATTATPDETVQLATDAGLRSIPTGLQHGTVTVVSGDEAFEVTTLRRDVTTDGRHANVAFTDDWKLDAARRDFTMNALYADADGTIFDPIGGFDDLKNKRIRFVGDATTRIREDYLRILRFFRFFAQYGNGSPDPAGLRACLAERQGLANLSSERIHQELMKLLTAPGVINTLETMIGHGLLGEILPIAANLPSLTRLVSYDPQTDSALRLAALTIHVHQDAERLTRHLRLSKQETQILKLCASILTTNRTNKLEPTAARRLLYDLGEPNYIRTIKLHHALFQNQLSDASYKELLKLPEKWSPPVLPINGNDLTELGAAPGPKLGETLRRIEQSWIQSDFQMSREALLQEATALLAKE